jgi:hypothetical protein
MEPAVSQPWLGFPGFRRTVIRDSDFFRMCRHYYQLAPAAAQ